jgi:hypothetical protein
MKKYFLLPLLVCIVICVGCTAEERTFKDGIRLGSQLSHMVSEIDDATIDALLKGELTDEEWLATHCDRIPVNRRQTPTYSNMLDVQVGKAVYISECRLNVSTSGRAYINAYTNGYFRPFKKGKGCIKVVKLTNSTCVLDLLDADPEWKWVVTQNDDYFSGYLKVVRIKNVDPQIKLEAAEELFAGEKKNKKLSLGEK